MEKIINLSDHEVSGLTKKRRGFEYLPWHEAIKVCKEHIHYAFTYEPGDIEFVGEFARVHVIVYPLGKTSELKWEYKYPVIDGDIPIRDPNILQIHIAEQRALVKCIAINTGLGLDLWSDGKDVKNDGPDLGEAITNMIGDLVQRFGTADEVLEEIGYTNRGVARIVAGKEDQQPLFDKLKTYFEDDFQ